MKNVIRITCLVLVILLLCSCGFGTMGAATTDGGKYLYLVAGLDDAAENTDVLFTLGFDTNSNTVSVAQIPRDTYFGFGKFQNKINQYYASKRSEGLDEISAMSYTLDAFSSAFGTKFDGFLALGVDSFSEIVDTIGGVDVEIPRAMIIELDGEEPIELNAGINHIDGKGAAGFVRYRRGYSTADLGRIDAQKLFLNALFYKLSRSLSLPQLLNLTKKLEGDAFTNIKLTEIASVLWSSIINKEDAKSLFVTLPGEAIIAENGLSYYVLNRKSAAEVVKRYMYSNGEFDRLRVFLNSKSPVFVNVYEDTDLIYKEYSNENVGELSFG